MLSSSLPLHHTLPLLLVTHITHSRTFASNNLFTLHTPLLLTRITHILAPCFEQPAQIAHITPRHSYTFSHLASKNTLTLHTPLPTMANMPFVQLIVAALSIALTLSFSIIDIVLFFLIPVAEFLAHWAVIPTSRLKGYSIYVYFNGKMDALHVSGRKQLEDYFQELMPLFEGNETEQNWTPRDNAVLKLRRLTWGDAPHRFPKVYVAGMKASFCWW